MCESRKTKILSIALIYRRKTLNISQAKSKSLSTCASISKDAAVRNQTEVHLLLVNSHHSLSVHLISLKTFLRESQQDFMWLGPHYLQ